eukprot:m.112870 g.112870  ORF g.112870 m.112870 type:complete len:66 (-) comp14107_c0_seq1:43-240(-)
MMNSASLLNLQGLNYKKRMTATRCLSYLILRELRDPQAKPVPMIQSSLHAYTSGGDVDNYAALAA